VHLVEVDPIGPKAAQAVLHLAHDPTPGVALVVGVVAHRRVELGGQEDIVPPGTGQCLADNGLRLALGIDIGGVDGVDARVQRAVDDADTVVVIGIAPAAEGHRAERQLADQNAGTPERPQSHDLPPDSRYRHSLPRRRRRSGGHQQIHSGQTGAILHCGR
jgi:hypothetical protein